VHQARGQGNPRIPRPGYLYASRQGGRRGARSGQVEALCGPAKRVCGTDDEGCARRRRLRGPDPRSGLESAADLDRKRTVSLWSASDMEGQEASVDHLGLAGAVSPDERRERQFRRAECERACPPCRSKWTGGECACESCLVAVANRSRRAQEGLSARVTLTGSSHLLCGVVKGARVLGPRGQRRGGELAPEKHLLAKASWFRPLFVSFTRCTGNRGLIVPRVRLGRKTGRCGEVTGTPEVRLLNGWSRCRERPLPRKEARPSGFWVVKSQGSSSSWQGATLPGATETHEAQVHEKQSEWQSLESAVTGALSFGSGVL